MHSPELVAYFNDTIAYIRTLVPDDTVDDLVFTTGHQNESSLGPYLQVLYTGDPRWQCAIVPDMPNDMIARMIRSKLTGIQSGTECPICTDPFAGGGHAAISCNHCTGRICGICYVKNIEHNQGLFICPFCRHIIGHQRDVHPGQTQSRMAETCVRLGMSNDELREVGWGAGADSDANDDSCASACSNPACSDAVRGTRVCSRCQRTHYCSRNCQKQHWKVHKKQCHAKSKGLGKGPPLKKPPRDGGCGGGGCGSGAGVVL